MSSVIQVFSKTHETKIIQQNRLIAKPRNIAIASSIMCKINFVPAKELAKDGPFDG